MKIDQQVRQGDTIELMINMGPQHPSTHGVFRIVVWVEGERIVRSEPHIGYLHSGFEKLGEHLDYNQYVTIVSRMNYISPIANDICWHTAVEKLFGLDLTPGQTTALLSLSAVVLGLVARQRVSPR